MKLALGKVKEKLDFMGEIRYSRERKCRKYVGLIVIWDILKPIHTLTRIFSRSFNSNMGYIETQHRMSRPQICAMFNSNMGYIETCIIQSYWMGSWSLIVIWDILKLETEQKFNALQNV